MSNEKVKMRSDILPEYKWDIEAMYATTDDFNKDFEKLKEIAPSLSSYQGKLNTSEKLLEFLKLDETVSNLASNLMVYSTQKYYEDTTNVDFQQLKSQIGIYLAKASSYSAFFVPEIISMDEKEVFNMIDSNAELKTYRFLFNEIFVQKQHVLSKEEEELLSKVSDCLDSPSSIFSMLTDADIKFGNIENEKGETVELNEVNYTTFLRSKNRDLRKRAFNQLLNTYGNYKNTLAESLGSNVKAYIFTGKVRHYNSSLESALKPNNIPIEVYKNSIKTINDNLSSLHRYIDIKKSRLGLKEMHIYDLYAPVFDEVESKIEFYDGVDIVKNALKPLGKEYVSIFDEGIKNRWVDIYPNKGKHHGAFSWGSYNSMPYILLNYDYKLRDVSTLAHEMGHSIHSYYTRKNQPFHYGHYPIFLAEVASTTNEILLSDYLIKNETDEIKKLSLVNEELEQIRATVFRQLMFAEFELIIHESFEQGNPLTESDYRKIWTDLNQKYFGPSIIVDEAISMEWARIPHFYSDFYVYQYATGYAAATAFATNILNDNSSVEKYLGFLKSGASDYPINILKKAGVDMTSSTPLENTINRFNSLLDIIEKAR